MHFCLARRRRRRSRPSRPRPCPKLQVAPPQQDGLRLDGRRASGGVKLGEGTTKKALYPAEAEDVAIDVPNPSMALTDGSTPVYVVLDDGMPEHLWQECRTENNKVAGSGYCVMPG